FLLCALTAASAPGLVRTLDSNSISGQIRFTGGGIAISNAAGQTTVPLTNLLRFEMSGLGSNGPRGKGIGLLGFYFGDTNLSGDPYVRLDETVNFSWAAREN